MKKIMYGMLVLVATILVGAACTTNTPKSSLLDDIDGSSELTDCIIKGNISSSGERIYHVPAGQYYDVTQIDTSKGERWFCSEAEAEQAGWRKSKR